jgi:hypothetical protein
MVQSNPFASAAPRALAEPISSALARLASRLRRGVARQVATGAAAPQAAPKNDALIPTGRRVRPVRVLMAVVIGLDAAALERTLAMVHAGSGRAEGAALILFLTDGADFEPFRSRGLLFEYLPPAPLRERFAPDLDWDLYMRRRLARLRRKWSPARIVAFGPDAQALIAQWRASPFEDEDIRDLIGAPRPAGEAPGVAD